MTTAKQRDVLDLVVREDLEHLMRSLVARYGVPDPVSYDDETKGLLAEALLWRTLSKVAGEMCDEVAVESAARGVGWSQLGAALGISRQAAWARWASEGPDPRPCKDGGQVSPATDSRPTE